MKLSSKRAIAHDDQAERGLETFASNLDHLAREIFARLQDGRNEDTRQNPIAYLTHAATALLSPTGREHERLRSALRKLTAGELETLLLHIEGLTYTQIARRQGAKDEATLQDLTKTYRQLRMCLVENDTEREA